MKYIFALLDKVSETWNDPVYYANEKLAIRDLRNVVNQKNTIYNTNPEDFELWLIGYFNELTGELNGDEDRFVTSCKPLKETPFIEDTEE